MDDALAQSRAVGDNPLPMPYIVVSSIREFNGPTGFNRKEICEAAGIEVGKVYPNFCEAVEAKDILSQHLPGRCQVLVYCKRIPDSKEVS